MNMYSQPCLKEAVQNSYRYGVTKTFKEILCSDYVTRHNQINLLQVLNWFFPFGEQRQGAYYIRNYKINLECENLGQWQTTSSFYLPTRPGTIHSAFNSARGNSLESFFSHYFGVPLEMVPAEIDRLLSLKASLSKRYLLHELPGHAQIPSFRIDGYKFGSLCAGQYQHAYRTTYAYTTLDGSFRSFVEYYVLESPPYILKMPVTLWQNQRGSQHLDYLHPTPPFPVYGLHHLGQSLSKPVLTCADEAQAEHIREKYPGLLDYTELTTWSGGLECSIEGTDWGYLQGRPSVTIWAGSTKESFSKAYKVYRALVKAGVQNVCFLIAHAVLEAEDCSYSLRLEALGRDLARAYYDRVFQTKAQFLREANSLFGLRLEAEHEISAISARDLLALEETPTEYALAPVLARGDKAMLCAPRGSGKSWLVMALALLIALGGSLFDGRLSCPRPLRVLIIDGELKLKDLRSRMRKLLKSIMVSPECLDNLRIIAQTEHGGKINLDTPEGLARLRKDITWADVIFADSVYCLWPSAMSSQIEGCQALNDFMAECSSQGKTVIVVDHTGRDQKSSYGTIGKELGLDLMWMLKKPRKDQDRFHLEITKGRNLSSAETPSYIFDLISDEVSQGIRLELVKADGRSLPAPKANLALPAAEPETQAEDEPTLTTKAEAKLDDLDRQILALNKEDPELSGQKIAAKLQRHNSTVAARITKLKAASLWTGPTA